jgi:serine/threonine protein kinase
MLGRYEVLKHLASGGMADVLIARATGIENFERHVVIKQIRAEQARDQAYVTMFLNEARLAASLHHANIVQVHDVGQEAGEYFFAMEYVHGEDLRSLLTLLASKKLVMPIEHVVTIVTSAAAGLHYAHELRGQDRKPLGIVHRDVSPANILVGYDGNVKLVDFGIAKASSRVSIETNSGTLKGKVAYMAPEQCIGMPVDRRSDVFALGIVLYELVTVRRLFKAETDFLTMAMITAGEIPKPSTIRPDLPAELEGIILKALSMTPEDRFQTAEEMRLALEEFAGHANLRTSTTMLGDFLVKQFGRRTEPWMVDDDEPEIRLDVDFDGPAARPGATENPTKQLVALAKARKTASAMRAARVEAAAAGFDVANAVPTTASGTPMAFESSPIRRKRRPWLVPVIVLGALTIFGVVMASGVFTGGSQSARPAATVTTPTPPPAAPAPPPPPPPPPAQAEPGPETPPPQPEVAATVQRAEPAAKPKRPKAKPPAKPIVKPGSWNPDSLFPKGSKP